MANNDILFNAIIAGATGGVQMRWIIQEQSDDYNNIRNAVLTFATEVDLTIPADPTTSVSDAQLLQSICAGVLAGRFIYSLTSSEYSSISRAIAALYLKLREIVIPQPTGIIIVQTQDFIVPGAAVWTKPDLRFHLAIIRTWGGGGGGSGCRARSGIGGACAGGGGGGGGAFDEIFLFNDQLSATENLFVGSGGAGSVGTTGADPLVSGRGTESWFGTIIKSLAFGGGGSLQGAGGLGSGGGGGGGQVGRGFDANPAGNTGGGLPVSGTSPGTGATGQNNSGFGGAGNINQGTGALSKFGGGSGGGTNTGNGGSRAAGKSVYGGGGGAGGNGVTNTGVTGAGSIGGGTGKDLTELATSGGGTAGANGGGAGGNGADGDPVEPKGGAGGGSGGSAGAAVGGRGGNGGLPGGGGGGGGCSNSVLGGDGGTGAGGRVWVRLIKFQ